MAGFEINFIMILSASKIQNHAFQSRTGCKSGLSIASFLQEVVYNY